MSVCLEKNYNYAVMGKFIANTWYILLIHIMFIAIAWDVL